MLIIFDGLDAAGKCTQSKMLHDRFEHGGRSAFIFSFPRYETIVGRAILRLLKNETTLAEGGLPHAADEALVLQALFLSDKCDAAVDIEAHLGLGRIVICDRWWQSALAFGVADGLDENWVHRIHVGLPTPYLNIFIDVPPEEALKRRPEARDRYERDREKQIKVRENYERLWTNAGGDYVKIDGLGTPDEVHARIWHAIQNRLPPQERTP
jgi:dTMP kinase